MRRMRSGRLVQEAVTDPVVDRIGMPLQLLEPHDSFLAIHVDITATSTNSGNVAVGGIETRVVAGEEAGTILDAGEQFTETDINMSEVWVDIGTEADSVHWLATYDDGQ